MSPLEKFRARYEVFPSYGLCDILEKILIIIINLEERKQ